MTANHDGAPSGGVIVRRALRRVLLDGQAEALLRALPEPGDFDQAVQRLLLRVLPEGAEITFVAADAAGSAVSGLARAGR